jgi:hypothetical protein
MLHHHYEMTKFYFQQMRKLHKKELHNLYSSPNIIRKIKSRKMRHVGHVARIKEKVKVKLSL